MQHETCQVALKKYLTSPTQANVSNVKEECKCEHIPTPCNWVGNGTMFACLNTEKTQSQRVYTHFNGTKAARIVSPRSKN